MCTHLFLVATILFNALRISSFNCKNVRSSVDEVRKLCDTSDIVILQEMWLSDADIPFLTTIDNNFYSTGVSAMKCDENLLRGQPHRGLKNKSIGYIYI